MEVVTSLSLAEKDFACLIQQRDTSCKSYTICLAQSRNRETQRRNYPREGRLEGVEGEKGEEGEKGGGGGGHIVDGLPAGRVSCTSTYYPLHSTNPPSSNLSSFDTTKHAMRDTRKQAFVVYDTCVH